MLSQNQNRDSDTIPAENILTPTLKRYHRKKLKHQEN